MLVVNSEISEQAPANTALTPVAQVESSSAADLDRALAALYGDVALSTRRIYGNDAYHFSAWLAGQRLALATIDYEGLSQYRMYLADRYSKPTAARMLVVARRLLEVAVILKFRPDNPAAHLKGFKGSSAHETTHRALTREEARRLLAAIDQTTDKGKRDYALILLLLRTGIRRAEAASLTLADIGTDQGHNIITIQHGKGDKRRQAKLPVDVLRAINLYLEATGRLEVRKDAPLFVSFIKGDKPRTPDTALGGKDIERIVEGYARQCDLPGLSPHGLRASFVTLTLEGGARLQQVQYAAGHADPRTTERYQKRKLNLDDNAVDYLKIN